MKICVRLLIAMTLLLSCWCVVAKPVEPLPVARYPWEQFSAQSTKTIDHGPWQQFLDKYVITDKYQINKVNYSAITHEDRNRLYDYLWTLSQVHIADYNRDEQLAFWINLYNALIIKTVSEHYPVSSINDINTSPGFFTEGPWQAVVIKVDGVPLSLSDIKNRIIRPVFKDPRVHYALNNGTIGAPNLQKTAFNGQNINQQLNKAAAEFVNALRGVQVIKGQLVCSSIYVLYMSDFGTNVSHVLEHLRRYAHTQLRKELADVNKIERTTYNWHLNDLRPQESDALALTSPV